MCLRRRRRRFVVVVVVFVVVVFFFFPAAGFSSLVFSGLCRSRSLARSIDRSNAGVWSFRDENFLL
jgi:hypothetical protein